MERIEEILTLTQEELFNKLLALPDAGMIEQSKENIIIPGTAPLVMLAHMDTVYDTPPVPYRERGRIVTAKGAAGIGGDDRCGVWLCLQTLQMEFRPTLVFCQDEESCHGSSVGLGSLDWSDYKAFIEVDGPGYGVYYSDSHSNSTLDRFLEDEIGLTMETPGYNDIHELCKTGNPPGVTLGAAYYNQHDKNAEWISLLGLEVQGKIIKEIMKRLDRLPWSVLEASKVNSYHYQGSGSSYSNYSNYDEYAYGTRYTVNVNGESQVDEPYEPSSEVEEALDYLEFFGVEKMDSECKEPQQCKDCELVELCAPSFLRAAKALDDYPYFDEEEEVKENVTECSANAEEAETA